MIINGWAAGYMMVQSKNVLGLLGAVLCLVALLVEIICCLYITDSYVREIGNWCGTPRASLHICSVIYGLFLSGASIVSYMMISKSGLRPRRWRFCRDLTIGLAFFTWFFICVIDRI